MKNLIIAPSWLGDLIMSQCLCKILKKQDVNCTIDMYAPAYTLPIVKRMPEVNSFIVNPFGHGSFNLRKRFEEGRKLFAKRYDRAFILPNSFKSALIAFFAGIGDRRGFKGESRYLIINNLRCNKNDFPMMVQRYAALAFSKQEVKTASDLPPFDYPSLQVKPLTSGDLKAFNLNTDKKYLVLGCGANYGPAKLWPASYFAEVSLWWMNRGRDFETIVLGSAKDKNTAKLIKTALPSQYLQKFNDLTGMTTLTQALDILGMSTAAVCNDSGLMHSAAAAGLPQVCIFGSTSTAYTPPLSKFAICIESDAVCHPCFKRTCLFGSYACLTGIYPQLVIEKLQKLTINI